MLLSSLMLMGLSLAAGSAQGLEIRVQGESVIELDAHVAGTVLQISGSLQDDLGVGLPAESVEIFVRNYRETLLSETIHADYQGRFSRVVEYDPGVYEVEVRYRGGSHISSSVAQQSVTLEALPTEMRLTGPHWVTGPEPRAELNLQATAGGRGLATFVTLSVNGELVASIDLDADGRGTFELGPYLRVGDNAVFAQIEGSQYRETHSAEFSLRRADSIQIRGEADHVFRRLERGVEVEVFISDSGRGIEGAEVAIELAPLSESEEPIQPLVASVRTDQRGRAVGFFPFDELGKHVWEPTARVIPPEGDPILWEGAEVQQEDSIWGAVVRILAILAVAGGAFWLARRTVGSAWGALLAVLARARENKSDDSEDGELFSAVEEVDLVSIAQPVGDEKIAPETLILQIWDVWRDLPVVGAQLHVSASEESESPTIEVTADEKGMVELLVSDGDYEIYVEAPGFVPARTELTSPSKRRHLRMSLTPVPLKIRQMYRWMLERVGGRDHWGRLTPREIEDVLWKVEPARSQQAPPRTDSPWRIALSEWPELDDDQRVAVLLEAITDLVEETNFSGRDYDQSIWETSRAAMEELARRLQLREKEDHHEAP